MRATARAEKEQARATRETFRKVGEVVRRDAAGRIAHKSPRSARGYKVRVRQRGIAVEQSLRKTTGRHAQWGTYQMRHALLPALRTREDETMRELERAFDKVADHFNNLP
jgi:hypothetical protein